MTASESSALWVALSEHGDGDIFSIYSRLLTKLFSEEDGAPRDAGEAERLVLPSERGWRLQQYFYLVSLQKPGDGKTLLDRPEVAACETTSSEAPEEWAPWNVVETSMKKNPSPPVEVKANPGPAWEIEQVLKAARLLCKPAMPVAFDDEQEMRRVYSLIYDVFRFKSILDQSIEAIEFFDGFEQFILNRNLVWLFLMELARRGWAARPRASAARAHRLLRDAGWPFRDVEAAVWAQRVHFAAAIARIRIKAKAFSLAELLPPHLRDDRVAGCVNKEAVTGWVNTFKAKKVTALVKRLHEQGYSYSTSKQLCAGEYRFDRVCPMFITIRPVENGLISQLDLVKKGIIVIQEREFCSGASTLCRALRAASLRGAVAQTHASSPRCSAYLAAQLQELAAVLRAKTPPAPVTPDLGKLVVFGAGDKVDSYISSLQALGIDASPTLNVSSVCVIGDAVHCGTPRVASALEGVVAVLATPPNSYSAVTDPIDLVCGRGGDLAMLEMLTETELNLSSKERVKSILEEQKKTLKVLLSKPQIQMILYETHSSLEAENQLQVTRAVAEANRLARDRHYLLLSKPHAPKNRVQVMTAETEVFDEGISDLSGAESASRARPSRPQSGSAAGARRDDAGPARSRPGSTKARPIPIHRDVIVDENYHVKVPDCDLFEVQSLPHVGHGVDLRCVLDRDGCYLSLIQRKEMTHLDAKYMIRVAEERGLFGAAPERAPAPEAARAPARRRRRKQTFAVERIAAPTLASLSRARRAAPPSPPLGPSPAPSAAPSAAPCERHAKRHAAAATGAACSCPARHKSAYTPSSAKLVKTKSGGSPDSPRRPATGPCRRVFPVFITELRLRSRPKVYTVL